MARANTIVVVGAGIGGLTTALALARAGFGVTLIEAAPRLEEIGAGIQLSPNATQVLLSLGLGPALKPHLVALEAVRVMNARSGREIVTIPLGVPAAVRYGAPFWTLHRGDLQRALVDAVKAIGAIDLRLGARVEEIGERDDGVTVVGRMAAAAVQFAGSALIGADGLNSTVRARLGDTTAPRRLRQTAWRALLPADQVPRDFREPATTLWLGPKAHVVHYPVSSGRAVNVVAIIREPFDATFEKAAPSDPAAIQARFVRWAEPLRALIASPETWSKWPLADRVPLSQWGAGRATLLGDAAHPMRPFLAQGAAMAIEDAAVLARALAAQPDDIAGALRIYEQERRPRTARVVAEAARTGRRYGWRGPLALGRNLVLERMGGDRLLARYDWIYEWKST